MIIRLLIFALAIAAGPALAQSPSPVPTEGFFLPEYQDPSLASESGGGVGSVFGFLVKLGFVVGLIYASLWAYKRFMLKGPLPMPMSQGGGGMRVLETVSLRGSQTLHLVSVGDRLLVVGSDGKASMTAIAELPRGTLAHGFAEQLGRAESEPDAFDSEIDATIRRVIRPEGL